MSFIRPLRVAFGLFLVLMMLRVVDVDLEKILFFWVGIWILPALIVLTASPDPVFHYISAVVVIPGLVLLGLYIWGEEVLTAMLFLKFMLGAGGLLMLFYLLRRVEMMFWRARLRMPDKLEMNPVQVDRMVNLYAGDTRDMF